MFTLRKIISCAVAIVIIVSSLMVGNILESYACSGYLTWTNDAKLIGGVVDYGNHIRRYWVDSSASGFDTLIGNARYDWVNTSSILTTPIYIRKATQQSSSVFDIYYTQAYPSGIGILAESLFYDSSNNNISGTPSADYKWTEIILNGTNFFNLSTFNQQGTISHEFGHCMGLAHSTDTGRIMTQLGNGRTVNSPAYDDLDTINHLY